MSQSSQDILRELQERVQELESFRDKFLESETKLQRSESKYQTLLQTIPDIVYVVDENGVFRYLNNSICRLGFHPDELLGKHFSELIHPEDIENVSRESVLPQYRGKETGPENAPRLFDERRTGDRRTKDLEVRLRTNLSDETESPDTSYSLVCASGYYRTDTENGETVFLGTIGVMRDITARKQSEEILRQREEFNYALFEYNPIETVVVDLEGKITRMNLAKRKSGARMPRIGDVMYRDYASRHELDLHSELMECIESGELRHFPELRYRNQVLTVTISPFPQGAIITSQDITNRKRTEEALRESERRFRETADLLPTLVCELDCDRKVTYVNRTGLELLGYSAFDIQRGLTFFDIIHQDDHQRARLRTDQAIQGKRLDAVEYRAVHKDGKEIALLMNFSAIRKENTVSGVRASGMNISLLKEMEKELQKTQILESLGILAGGIGHDFNNILAGIVGNVQLAQKKLQRGESATSYLQGINKATERAVSLSHQLLTFSKGGAPIKKIASVSELLRETAGFALRGSNVGCEFDIDQDLWQCQIDQGQISQVVNNLVINASQSMIHGGTITINARNDSLEEDTCLPLKPGPYVRIAIEDQGSGIPPEHLRRVFEPYFTTKRKGTGLGLAVSYSIVSKHAGYITVDSRVNRGTTFTVYLPAQPVDTKTPEVEEVEPLGGTGRILLMDDDDIVREVGSETLNELGYEVVLAEHGQKAVDLYCEAARCGKPFAAVILDLTVPGGMGGKDTLAKIREFDESVRAIVSSGYSDDPIMASPEQYGFCGVIRKPYDMDELDQVVRSAIR